MDSGARTNPYHPLKGAKSAFRASPAVPSLQIPSPGFKSDILHGKTGLCGPQPPASSHIWRPLVWNTCAVTLDYNTIQPPVLQGFFEIFPDFFQFSIPVKTRAPRRGCPGKKPQKNLGFSRGKGAVPHLAAVLLPGSSTRWMPHTAAVLAWASKSAKVNFFWAQVSRGRKFSKMHRQPSSLAAL